METPLLFLLGASGATGRLIADLLLRESDVRLRLGGRRLDPLQRLASALNDTYPGERVSCRAVDAGDSATLTEALAGVRLLIVASGTARQAMATATATLAAGCDWLDIQYSSSKLQALRSLQSRIEQQGCCFITDGGFHPGLAAVLVREAGRQLEELESAQVGSLIKLNWREVNASLATAEEMVEEFTEFQPLVWGEEKWRRVSLASGRQLLRFDFGAPWGARPCTPMLLQEMLALPRLFPGLRETGFHVGGFNPVTDYLVLPLMLGALRIWPRRAIRPAARLFVWSLHWFSRPPYATILQLEARGRTGGREEELRLRLTHPDGYYFTAAATVAALLQYLDQPEPEPGLHFQALWVEPARMLADLQRLGISCEQSLRPPSA